MGTLLEAKRLTKYFTVRGGLGGGGTLRAVDGVDLRLEEGETLGLAGESGCGKSTVGRLLMRLLEPTGGEVFFRGRDMRTIPREGLAEFRREVQMIFQDPFASLNPRMRIGQIIGEPFHIHRSARRGEVRQRVLQLMERVGLSEEHYDRYPHEFSGGQRQRVGIARALAMKPKVMIADEPVSALDLSIQAQIMNLMLDLQREERLSYIFIAHDLSVVRHMSTRIAIMYLGRIVETGAAAEVFDRYLHPYTEALISAVPLIERKEQSLRIVLRGDLPSPIAPPSGCPFHTRCPYAEGRCVNEVPPLEEKEPGHFAACHFSHRLFRNRVL